GGRHRAGRRRDADSGDRRLGRRPAVRHFGRRDCGRAARGVPGCPGRPQSGEPAMKRRAVVCAVLLALAVSGCARQVTPSGSSTALGAGAWPDKDYTDGFPVPPGAVAWAMLDTERQYCSVHLTNVSESDCAAYIEAVQEAGFSVVEHA